MTTIASNKRYLLAVIPVLAVIAAVLFKNTKSRQTVEDVDEIEYELNLTKKIDGYSYANPITVTYYSDVAGTDRQAMVFLPVDYKVEKQYPVLYLFHGLNGNYESWSKKGADVLLQNLYNQGEVTEMIVVCVDSSVGADNKARWSNERKAAKAYDLTAIDTVQSLMPYINEHYSVKTGRENTAVAGYSMGGRNAIYTAFTYPDTFGYVGAFSTEYVIDYGESPNKLEPLLDDLSLPADVEPFELIMLCVGRDDDDCGIVSYDLNRYMENHNIDHIFYEFDGGHESKVWQRSLLYFSKKIFKDFN